MSRSRHLARAAVVLVIGAATVVVVDRVHDDSLGALVVEQSVADNRARLHRVELGAGDSLDRLGVQFGPDTPAEDLPDLAAGDRRFGFVTTGGCTEPDPSLVVADGGLAVRWGFDPDVGCAPQGVHVAVFDVDADDLPSGVDTSSDTFGELRSWRMLDGVEHRVEGPDPRPPRDGDERRRFVLVGCEEERPPYLNIVDRQLVAAFPDLGADVDCDAPEYYAATFSIAPGVLRRALGPVRPTY